MRTFVSLVLAVLGLLGLGLAGELVAQAAIARVEGSSIAGRVFGGPAWMATGLIGLAALWVTSAWRLHVNGQKRAEEAARSDRLRRLNDRLRLTNEHLRASDKIKSDLLATTSHELRTPLTAILGFTEMLLDTPDPGARALAIRVRRGGERLHNTVNGLLDMFKLQSGTLELAPGDIDAASLVRGTVAMLQPLAQERGLHLRVYPEGLALPAHIDQDALERIVTNLVSNALKFTEEGGVSVTVDGTEEGISLSVIDSGIGIDQRALPSLFQPFTQGTSGVSRSHEGTGLGLAIVRQLVDLMGGRIQVESRLGVGTMVKVEVPRWASRLRGEASERLREVPPSLAGGQMLTLELGIDDVAEIRPLLSSSGAVFGAETVGRAVRELRRTAYDAVFVAASDVRTERSHVRQIRRVPGYARTPLLRVGGEPLDADELRLRGFTHQLESPLRDAPLRDIMETLLMDVEAVVGISA